MKPERAVADLESFLAERGDALLRTAVLLAGSREAGEDLLQSALERLLRHWRKIEGDPEGYLRRTLYHLAADSWRQQRARRKRLRLLERDADAAVADGTADVELRDSLLRLLRQLPPRQRAVVVARYWEQLSEAESAQVLGCSVGTVKSAASRGLRRLRELSDSTRSGRTGVAGISQGAEIMSTELEQRLHSDMERATQGVRIQPGLALTAYRHQRKRTVRTRVVAGMAVVLIAATLGVAGVSGAFGGGPPADQQVHGRQAQMVAYVISRVERSLSSPDMATVIAATRTVYPAGTTLQPVPGGLKGSSASGGSSPEVRYELLWASHVTTKLSAFSAGGQRVFDEQITLGGRSLGTTAVVYTSHTWWTAQSARPAVAGGGSASCLPGGGIRLSGGAGGGWPGFVRSQLACGAYTIVGRQAVDGVDALEITGSSGHLALWVSPKTYLPVRLEAGGLQTDFQWLPPTPANRAMLNMPVPVGFHQVQAPA